MSPLRNRANPLSACTGPGEIRVDASGEETDSVRAAIDDPRYRPWEFLFPLQVLKDPPIPLTAETRISGSLVGMLSGKEVDLAKVEDWGGGRVLLQTRPGLEASISWEYFAVAKALGMTPVQQLVEGSAPPRTATR